MKRITAVLMLLFSLPAFALDAQKIAEIKANGAESLWQFLGRLPGSFEAQVFYGLAFSAAIGMISSWLWKWSQGQADSHWWTWRYVFGQILWIIGSSLSLIMMTGFSTESGEFFGWLSVCSTGALAGFSGEVKTKPT